ncbi:hypothetical protein [Thiomonas sp. X19]|uniref:hypothetical protein n=1 Tax=Thiomonas sp. X19 TaxID=1050370 RepID=UPI000DD67EC5|nr:hypothetical protein [Thiomonas sp. X19]
MPRLIIGIDASNSVFLRTLDRVRDLQRRREIIQTLRSLFLLDLDAPPAKLHLHQLTSKSGESRLNAKQRVPIWTVHVTADDAYKASFTFESGTAYFRAIKHHDALDKEP